MIRWYQPIEDLSVQHQPFVTDTDDLCGFDEWDFRAGKQITNWPESVCVSNNDLETDGPPDDALRNHLGLPIFSHNLREALQLFGILNIQYLPVSVFRSDGSLLRDYSIANILDLIPALDKEQSDYDVYERDYFLPERRGKISNIRKAVLVGARIRNKDILRLEEFPVAEFVSDKFVQAYRSFKCTGYSFHEVTMSAGESGGARTPFSI